MKKILALVLAFAFIFSFAACTKEPTVSNAHAKKELVMATNAAFPPYEYKEGDSFKGIDIEIAEAIAEKLGMTLVIKDVEFGTIIGGVKTGKFDIGMAGMTVTEDRKVNVNFSKPYATGIQVVIVKEDCKYKSYEEFWSKFDEKGNPAEVAKGIKIGVQQDTTGDIYASDTLDNWGFTADNVICYKTGAEAVQALMTNKVMAVIIDNEPAKSFVKANKGLKIMDAAYTEEEYAIAVSKENTELLEKINKALDELTADGTIKKIIDKYIPAEEK